MRRTHYLEYTGITYETGILYCSRIATSDRQSSVSAVVFDPLATRWPPATLYYLSTIAAPQL